MKCVTITDDDDVLGIVDNIDMSLGRWKKHQKTVVQLTSTYFVYIIFDLKASSDFREAYI